MIVFSLILVMLAAITMVQLVVGRRKLGRRSAGAPPTTSNLGAPA